MKCKNCGAWLAEGAMFCGECGSSVLAASAMSDTQRITRVSGAEEKLQSLAGSATDAVWATPAPQTFLLVFSTGEEVEASGAGLVGRNPVPDAGEDARQIVRIVDPLLSVSKTHLEFGEESGNFWVCDRSSGNGTVILVPGQEARRAVPGERYAVPRGTRIRIGDEFFDLR
jgi:hypothetical protein